MIKKITIKNKNQIELKKYNEIKLQEKIQIEGYN